MPAIRTAIFTGGAVGSWEACLCLPRSIQADPNADHSDSVTVLLATALAAGVTPAELETAVRGLSSRPGAQSGGRPEDSSRARRRETAPRIWANDDGLTAGRNPPHLKARQSA